jgi:ATP-dependent DNA helicase RecG
MSLEQPDWNKLQKALSIEAERGFNDIQGKHHIFHDFLYLSLKDLLEIVPPQVSNRCQNLIDQFGRYPQLDLESRQHLIAETRRFLLQTQRSLESRKSIQEPNEPQTLPSQISPTPKVSQPPHKNVSINDAITEVVGPRNGNRLLKLGVQSIYDLLYYYPRDHLDYARQVKIRELEPGETVTLVARIKRCHYINSSKNKKLTIMELVLNDETGQLKISRFFAGNRYRSSGWQYQQKKFYPKGALIAASGLVKKK